MLTESVTDKGRVGGGCEGDYIESVVAREHDDRLCVWARSVWVAGRTE